MVKVAAELMKLQISNKAVSDLLLYFPLEEIEAQIRYLPFRKYRRPGPFLIDAIRFNYSPPKEFYYAQARTQPTASEDLDSDTEPVSGPGDAETQGQ